MKIFCFGDSITWGAWDSEGGWTARLRSRLEARDEQITPRPINIVYNMGVSSDTAQLVLNRFKSEVDARLLEGTDGVPIFIFSIGTNDCIKDTTSGKFWTDPDDYKANVRKLIVAAKDYSERIVFLGNLGVDESKTHSYAWDPDSETSNSDIEMYEGLTREVCDAEGVGFIEVYSLHTGDDMVKYLSPDGLHENNAGHEFLSELAWGYISKDWL
jgi:lysophospholipase L1-like esterase